MLKKKLIVSFIILLQLIVTFYILYIRFNNPTLTETQLFLKMIGLN